MIARIWHGVTLRAKADGYLAFLLNRAVPDYQRIPGNLGVQVLRRDEGDETHFLTLTHWSNEEAIRAFAGEDISVAKYYPEDVHFLLAFEPTVQHFLVFPEAMAPTGPDQALTSP